MDRKLITEVVKGQKTITNVVKGQKSSGATYQGK